MNKITSGFSTFFESLNEINPYCRDSDVIVISCNNNSPSYLAISIVGICTLKPIPSLFNSITLVTLAFLLMITNNLAPNSYATYAFVVAEQFPIRPTTQTLSKSGNFWILDLLHRSN